MAELLRHEPTTFRVTLTFDSDRCPFRRFIPQGYGCNLMDGAPCTGRNCPALTPGGDTLDLGVPCSECGATDGWVCECGFTPTKAITSEDGGISSHLVNMCDLLRQIEDGYEEDYLLCDECAEGGCDGIDCKCACHASAGKAKYAGRGALVKLRQMLEAPKFQA